MEIIWIIGVGKFGTAAAKRLSQQHKNWQFVLVDPVKENLLKANAITAITGATITGRAVISALEKGKKTLDAALEKAKKENEKGGDQS